MNALTLIAAAASHMPPAAPADFSAFHLRPALGQAVGLAVYCIATLAAVGVALARPASFKDVLKDKSLLRTQTIAPTPGEALPASFSRLAGLIGILYLTAFLWSIGFFILTYIWVDPTRIGQVMSDCGQFLMAGSALFAPYAFNQLSQIFSPVRSTGQAPGPLMDSTYIKAALTPAS